MSTAESSSSGSGDAPPPPAAAPAAAAAANGDAESSDDDAPLMPASSAAPSASAADGDSSEDDAPLLPAASGKASNDGAESSDDDAPLLPASSSTSAPGALKKEKKKKKKKKKKGKKKKQSGASSRSEASDMSDAPESSVRYQASRFVDDIAEVSDEDEDDEDEEEGGDYYLETDEEEDGDPRARKRLKGSEHKINFNARSAMHQQIDQEREQLDVEEELARITSKYSNETLQSDLTDAPIDELELAARLPDKSSPKLFLCRVDPGKERLAIWKLMDVYRRKHKSKREALFILSAFTTPASSGYIYIEAKREVHVKAAIKHVTEIKWWSVSVVPLKEMTQALHVQQQSNTVKKGDYVRIKRMPLYKGDLAKVNRVEDQGTELELKIVPRIDFNDLNERAQILRSAQRKKKVKRKRKRYTDGFRPPQKLFDEAYVNEIMPDSHKAAKKSHKMKGGRNYVVFDNQMYRKGFLIKSVGIRQVITDPDLVNPTPEEIELFQHKVDYAGDDDNGDLSDDSTGGQDQGQGNAAAAAAAAAAGMVQSELRAARKVTFEKGDKVIVITGDLKNLTGRVLTVYNQQVSVIPDAKWGTGSEANVFPVDQLRKYFNVGDHVKVTAGPHKNETGLVVTVEEDTGHLNIHSDINGKNVKVLSHDVIESTEVSSGLDSLANIVLMDLVELVSNDVGVVVKVDIGSFQVLTQTSRLRTVLPSEIRKKRHSRWATAMDANKRQIVKDNVVRVISGDYVGRTGTVLHLFRTWVFVSNRAYNEHNGVFCVRSRDVKQMGDQGASSSRDFVAQSPSSAVGGLPQVTRPRQRRRNGRFQHELIGKKVVIRQGLHKGYIGKCVEATDLVVRVELTTLRKTVQVPRNHVHVKQDDFSSAMQDSNAGNFIGGATPAHGHLGGQTPGANFGFIGHVGADASGMTPGGGMYGPGGGGGGGGGDAFTSATPVHSGYDYSDQSAQASNLSYQDSGAAAAAGSSTSDVVSAVATSQPAAGVSTAAQISPTHLLPVRARLWLLDRSASPTPGSLCNVISGYADGTYRVRTKSTSEELYVAPDRLGVPPVVNKETVYVLEGDSAGQSGEVVGIEGDECFVRLVDDAAICQLIHLVPIDK